MALSVQELTEWLASREEGTVLSDGVMEDLTEVASGITSNPEEGDLIAALIQDYERLSVELLDQLAYTATLDSVDPTLKIASRKGILDIILKEWEGSKRYHNAASLIIFSVDQALEEDMVTDVYVALADLIKGSTRLTDSFGRLDETRFILVVPTTNNIQAAWLSKKLLESISDSLEFDEAPITCSFGVADSDASMNEEDWLTIAEDAHATAVEKGGNQVVDYEDMPE